MSFFFSEKAFNTTSKYITEKEAASYNESIISQLILSAVVVKRKMKTSFYTY